MLEREIRRKKIENHLSLIKAAQVKKFHFVLMKTFLSNQDFMIAADGRWEEMAEIVEEESKHKVDFSVTEIANQELIDTWNLLEKQDFENKKLKKAECISQMAAILSDDTMFEGICLAFDMEDDALELICKAWSCEEEYQTLAADPVYQKRKEYQKIINCYTKAAVNLYGVLHLAEMEEILMDYEKSFLMQTQGFERTEGHYRNTVMYQPKYRGLYTLHHLIGNGIPDVLTTMDGMVMHMCFREEYNGEVSHMFECFRSCQGQEVGEKELDKFFTGKAKDSTYRQLLLERMEKPVYCPDKKEFLKYAVDTYREVSPAEKQLKKFFRKKLGSQLKKAAEQRGVTQEECIDYLIDEIYLITSDRGVAESKEPNEALKEIFQILQEYVILENLDFANETLSYVVPMMNSVRLWSNNGYSPAELAQLESEDAKNPPVVVPGSTSAAEILEEMQEDLEKMGIQVDTEATAAKVPVFAYPNGLNGAMEKRIKKVYPNDPCPCGSGKKFKKCCGK